jgi:hypothetical protein
VPFSDFLCFSVSPGVTVATDVIHDPQGFLQRIGIVIRSNKPETLMPVFIYKKPGFRLNVFFHPFHVTIISKLVVDGKTVGGAVNCRLRGVQGSPHPSLVKGRV